MKLCSIENCNKKHKARGFCDTHYSHLKPSYYKSKGSRITKKTEFCQYNDCNNKSRGSGIFCRKHEDINNSIKNNTVCLQCGTKSKNSSKLNKFDFTYNNDSWRKSLLFKLSA